jgi:hypothetical protein
MRSRSRMATVALITILVAALGVMVASSQGSPPAAPLYTATTAPGGDR